MNTRPVIMAIAPALLLGCSERAPRWTGTVEDSAGVTIVRNPDLGIWRAGEEWTLAEELRIGAVEGPDAEVFGAVVTGGITVDSRDRILVLDAQAQEIRVFSSLGDHIQTVGGRGAGPGELAGARLVLLGPGDTLFVPDRRNQRMSRFAPDGSFVGSTRYSHLEGGLSVEFRSNGVGVIAEQISPFVYGSGWPDDPQDRVVAWASTGTRSDTLATFPSGEEMLQVGRDIHTVMYAPEPCWDLTEDLGLLIGRNDAYRFGIYSSGRRLNRIVTKQHDLQPLLDRDISRVRRHMENRWSRIGASPADVARMWGQQHFAEFVPAFRALFDGPAETIWVQRVDPPSEVPEDEFPFFTFPQDWGSRDWDVFDGEGRYLGVVTMPRRFTPSVFRGDKIYGLLLDELGVAHVVRLRIVGDLDSA